MMNKNHVNEVKRWRHENTTNKVRWRMYTYRNSGRCYIRHYATVKGLLNYENLIKKRLNDLGYKPKNKKAVTN